MPHGASQITIMALSLSPQEAWEPLPGRDWNADAARHLLRRAGWTALPSEVERAARATARPPGAGGGAGAALAATLDRLFPAAPILLPKPRLTERVEAEMTA